MLTSPFLIGLPREEGERVKLTANCGRGRRKGAKDKQKLLLPNQYWARRTPSVTILVVLTIWVALRFSYHLHTVALETQGRC